MKIALAQIDCSLGDVEANCEKIYSYAKQSAEVGADVLVFPEMSDVGYEMSVISDKAVTWDGLPYRTLVEAAKEFDKHIICGIGERTETKIYNTSVVIDPKGELLAKYRKVHLFSPPPISEDSVFTAGEQVVCLPIASFNVGLSICYDLRFCEFYQALRAKGAELLINCTAWPTPRAAHWQALAKARAIENQAYFVGVNRVGTDGEVTFAGRSLAIDPYGEVLASGSPDKEELLVAEFDKDLVERFRGHIPISEHRRAEVYRS